MCWTISWQNKLHWLWHHGIALSGNALPSNYHQLPVLTQDLGSHKFPGDKTGSTTVVTQWLITTQTVTSTRNKKAPFLDTFRFSAMHCKELSVELHKFHTKPYDFKCVVILTLSLYIYSFIPLACAECDDSLLFSGASSIPHCYIPFPSTHFHQLFFHSPSLHLATYFLVCLSVLLFPHLYTTLLWELYFQIYIYIFVFLHLPTLAEHAGGHYITKLYRKTKVHLLVFNTFYITECLICWGNTHIAHLLNV